MDNSQIAFDALFRREDRIADEMAQYPDLVSMKEGLSLIMLELI
jgi:hypothetical protein